MENLLFRPVLRGVIAISLTMFFVPVSSAGDNNTTAQQCFDAFMQSPAASSCESSQSQTNIFVNNDGECEIADTCPTLDGQPRRSNITVSVAKASHVENCDGVLKLHCD